MSHHFQIVATHRRWVQAVFDLRYVTMKGSGYYTDAELSKVKDRVNVHDLSKYMPEEALGYYMRWVYPHPAPTEDPWDDSLGHHYCLNDHHLEYYGLQGDELIGLSGVQKWEMLDKALLEFVLDMLACKLERELVGQREMCLEQLVAINPPVPGLLRRQRD
jgi:hypothetical protein